MGLMAMFKAARREWRRDRRGKVCGECGRKFLHMGAHTCAKRATKAEMEQHMAAAEIKQGE